MKCLLDVNILVDLAATREPWVRDARAFVGAAETRGVGLCVTAASMPTLDYLVEKEVDRAAAYKALDVVLQTMTILTTDAAAIIAGRAMIGRDFEDNVQIACAVAGNCDLIITRDSRDFRHSPIRAVTAAEALGLITAAAR